MAIRQPGKRSRRQSKGFSLLEIVLVMAIIGILLGVVALNVGSFGNTGKIRATEASMNTIQTALDTYHLSHSAYPPTLDTLRTMKLPLLPANKPIQDGWKQAFHYNPKPNAQGMPYTLISFGGSEEWDPAVGIDAWTIGQN